jgi:hypothetical protein
VDVLFHDAVNVREVFVQAARVVSRLRVGVLLALLFDVFVKLDERIRPGHRVHLISKFSDQQQQQQQQQWRSRIYDQKNMTREKEWVCM